jgi:hypothetical protein
MLIIFLKTQTFIFLIKIKMMKNILKFKKIFLKGTFKNYKII